MVLIFKKRATQHSQTEVEEDSFIKISPSDRTVLLPTLNWGHGNISNINFQTADLSRNTG